jgi:hypothetical protein
VENLQLRSAFPGKPLIKTYVALRESCRSIAPLQLCFWEIFNLVDDFWSFAISKTVKRNRNGRRHRAAAPARVRGSAPTWRPSPGPAYGWPRRLRCGPSRDRGALRRPGPLWMPRPGSGPRRGKAPTRPRATLPRGQRCMPGQLSSAPSSPRRALGRRASRSSLTCAQSHPARATSTAAGHLHGRRCLAL